MSSSVTDHRTEVGSYFANYPPFSVWGREAVETAVRPALAARPAEVPLGLYLHIPFCRKQCHFCYFRVNTDKNAREVQAYLDTLGPECELYARQTAIAGRALNFVYFGGDTPSVLSTQQLQASVPASRTFRIPSWKSMGALIVLLRCGGRIDTLLPRFFLPPASGAALHIAADS